MSNILYTGFKGRYNSSFAAVNSMNGNRTFLTNSFGGIMRDISKIECEYDKIIMFGLDKTLKNEIRFEAAAEHNGEFLYTKEDFSEYIKKAEKLNLRYTVSNRPTKYLCNYAYFEMMKKTSVPVIFVHIPNFKNMPDNFIEKLSEVFNG